jgi:hypothetical protein
MRNLSFFHTAGSEKEVAMKRLFWLIAALFGVVLLAAFTLHAAPGKDKRSSKLKKQILVYAHRKENGIEYVYAGQSYSGKELDYWLGEWHGNAAKDSEVVVVLEDDLALSDVKDIPAMAMKAGFTDVRAFVYWKGTGNMAEVWFGPVVKVKKAGSGVVAGL